MIDHQVVKVVLVVAKALGVAQVLVANQEEVVMVKNPIPFLLVMLDSKLNKVP